MGAQTSLEDARERRRERFAEAVERDLDESLDAIGFIEGLNLGTANVSAADRKKLKGIVDRLRKNPKPFTQCMADLRKHQPGWSDERRKKTCSVLKSLTGRKNSGGQKSNLGEGACVLIDDRLADLLCAVDGEKLTQLEEGR